MLDLHRLRLLREFAERGTIAATAAALGYTPSAVSQQLAALEREAGAALLDREGIDGELRARDARAGRVEVVQMWGRPESVRREFARRRNQ